MIKSYHMNQVTLNLFQGLICVQMLKRVQHDIFFFFVFKNQG
jgi:hypothetical protein